MTQPIRPPAVHYREAERVLDAMPPIEGLTVRHVVYYVGAALVHAILATVPAKALRGQHRRTRYTDDTPAGGGGSLRERWLRGDDIEGDKQK